MAQWVVTQFGAAGVRFLAVINLQKNHGGVATHLYFYLYSFKDKGKKLGRVKAKTKKGKRTKRKIFENLNCTPILKLLHDLFIYKMWIIIVLKIFSYFS